MLNAFVAAEEAAHEGGGGSLLLPALPDLLWGTLAFVILLLVIWKKVLPSFNAMLDARKDAIEGGIKRAEEAQASAQEALDRYTAQLAEARGEAGKIRDQARADGQAILAEFKAQAQAEAARIAATAHAQIEAERQSALVSLRSEVGSIALDLASGVVGESLGDDAKASAVIDRFLADIEAEQSAGKK
ncbi:MAG TPA: F0F1 ATP synthase subunit B [Candidatus Lumbricidophila sp.]|nr:F0F1 ATP synthase subunit B [Candidatus Lumbricidophila sp.]